MNIVCIGGGHGLSGLLSELKNTDNNICAIVSTMDSGGSTGRIRDEFGVIALGDLRRAIVSLSENKNLKDKFNNRYNSGINKEHAFGNLFILEKYKITKSMSDAIKDTCKELKVKGKVLPVTYDSVDLFAQLEDGQVIKGEANIDDPKHNKKLKIKELFLSKSAKLNKDVESEIKKADLIIFSPGDLYTSLLCNMLVGNLKELILKSKAKKIWINNLKNKDGETTNFKLSDYLEKINKYIGENVIDYILVQKKVDESTNIDIDFNKIKKPDKIIIEDFKLNDNKHNFKKVVLTINKLFFD